MQHSVQENAEQSVREMLRTFAEKQGLGKEGKVTAVDHMDDGTPIQLTVTVNATEGSAEFDFEGTGPEVYNSCNAPPAVTFSAIIYSLRCMVKSEIPLNQVSQSQAEIHVAHHTACCVRMSEGCDLRASRVACTISPLQDIRNSSASAACGEIMAENSLM